MRRHWHRWLMAIAMALLLAGCGGEREQVMVPPRVDLHGARKIAILYLENYTTDPGLSLEVEQAIYEKLRGYYQVVDRASVEGALHKHDIRRGEPIPLSVIRSVGRTLQVDAVITGALTYYFEDVYLNTPQMVGKNYDGTARWMAGQTTNVVVTADLQINSVSNGQILYAKRAVGEYQSTSNEMLSWSQHSAPPESILPRLSRRDIPAGRMKAVRDAVESFTVDLLPTYIWRRVDHQ